MHKVDYKGDNNQNTRGFNNSTSKTDGSVRNLSKEHENEEDEEFKEDTNEINDTNESKSIKYETKEALISSLLAKHISVKLTQAVIFSIDTHK